MTNLWYGLPIEKPVYILSILSLRKDIHKPIIIFKIRDVDTINEIVIKFLSLKYHLYQLNIVYTHEHLTFDYTPEQITEYIDFNTTINKIMDAIIEDDDFLTKAKLEFVFANSESVLKLNSV